MSFVKLAARCLMISAMPFLLSALFLFSADFGVSVNNVPHRRVRGRLFV